MGRWRTNFLLGVVAVFSIALQAPANHASAADALSVGMNAPDFALPYATKDTIVFNGLRLSEEVKKGPIVLAFYPADWSGGCTKEICAFRDAIADLEGLGLRVWGISGDYVFSHHEWAKHHNLPFELLSDHDHAVAMQYGSYNAERGFNRRTVFVVGTDGLLTYVDYDYSVVDDADFNRLKEELAEME